MMHFLEGKTLYGRIALSCGQTLWLDPVECRMLLKSDHMILFCLNVSELFFLTLDISLTTAVFNPVQELKKVYCY